MTELFTTAANFRWQDIVDIIINSYLLFRLYILFRGTPVFRVLTGIALLWFLQRVAVSLGLVITSWVLQGITAVTAFIIIIVFRNEIRSVLQTRNLKTILWGFTSKATRTPVEIIVESVYELSRKHCGALIVFPGLEDIEEVVISGTPWKGLVSKEMISSIFWQDNPVHDGAAIIEGDRICDVGVILPLSSRNDLPYYYGTRHRAALGLAENTDALAIVVSEERGDVVIAREGKITPIANNVELAMILKNHLGQEDKHPQIQQKENLHMCLAAMLSVILITGAWLSFNRGSDKTLITLETPIEYINPQNKLEIYETSSHSVNLNLGGSGALIKSLGPEQVRVRIDLKNAGIGQNSFLITSKQITLPPGVSLRSVSPQYVNVLLDLTIEKKLPVQVDWTGSLLPDFILTEARLTPSEISVIGRKAILDNLNTLYTENVPLDAITGPGILNTKLALLPPSIKMAPDIKENIKIAVIVKRREK